MRKEGQRTLTEGHSAWKVDCYLPPAEKQEQVRGKKSHQDSGSELNLWPAPDSCFFFLFSCMAWKEVQGMIWDNGKSPNLPGQMSVKGCWGQIVKGMFKGSLVFENLQWSKQKRNKIIWPHHLFSLLSGFNSPDQLRNIEQLFHAGSY